MARRAGWHVARRAGWHVARRAVHRERDHVWPQLGEEGAAAQREQRAEALLVAHAPHAHAALARLAAAAAAAAIAAAAAAAVAAGFARGGARRAEGGAHRAGELGEERVLPWLVGAIISIGIASRVGQRAIASMP